MRLFLVALLLILASTATFVRQYDLDSLDLSRDEQTSSNNEGKVRLDFFYESLCPYCGQFITSSLKAAVATPVRPP